MRLIDALLVVGKDSSKFAIRNCEIGIRYNKKRDLMVYCDIKTGEYSDVESTSIWSYGNLFDDGWEVKAVINPKYKIGDRFLLSDLCYENVEMGKTVSKTMFNNPIGEIIASCYDGEKIRYIVSLNGKGFPLLLTEDYLSKLDMVVPHD